MSRRSQFTLARWYRDDGEIVRKDEPICEIETDKASADIPAEKDGILRHLAKVGDIVRIGEKVARIDPIT
jgi:2-oxoglutarate dehydrogenase E2 component (dihydrolipoamide succinyltransferase)